MPSAQTHTDAALAHLAQGDDAKAAESLRHAIEIDPTHAPALLHLGSLLLRRALFEPAARCLAAYVHRVPNAPATVHHDLGLAFAHLNQFGPAAAAFHRALQLDPARAATHLNLGLVLEDLHRPTDAIAALHRAAALDPTDPVIAFHLAALTGSHPPPICPSAYLTQFFDNYAPRFDQHLVHDLAYRGPELLFDVVARHAAPTRRFDILDLGCGTGLCAPLFAPRATSLIGIDLSPRMLALARDRNLYTQLVESDLRPALAARPASADLILAADVFIYVGDLAPLFTAASTALRTQGLFAFTLELLPSASVLSPQHSVLDFAVLPTRRYAHAQAYVHRLATHLNFTELAFTATPLRRGPTGDVAGAVVLLAKS